MAEEQPTEVRADGTKIYGPSLTPSKEERGARRIFAIVGVLVIAALAVAMYAARTQSGAETESKEAPLPVPASPYEADAVAQGLASAIANVVATMEDPDEGLPRVQEIGTDAQARTGCEVVGTDVNSAASKAEARELVEGYEELPGTGAAFQRVEYIESRREFVVIAISVICPGG